MISFSNWRTKRRERIRLRCQRMARRSNEVQAAARLLRPVDADTVRSRALDDARGTLLREGITVRTAGERLVVTSWEVRRSFHGRTNQVDIVCRDFAPAAGQELRTNPGPAAAGHGTVGARLLRTCSLRTATRLLARRPASRD